MGLNTPDDRMPPETTRLSAMVSSLKALLDTVKHARKVFPHLAALESDLKKHGLVVLQKAPVSALLKASQDLARMPLRQDDAPLQELGTMLLGELEARSQQHSGQYRSTFVSDSKLVVSEGSHTDFMVAAGLAEPKKP
ncbi:MAG: hypothetical protein IPP87_16105 [Ideonella sp.]|nr:hypothetical protein [Ideonella sp.]MBL0150134.1 hypothetical protein [Ideonella sp.]